MELYLMRHGIAEDGLAGESDSLRKLTREGREKVAAVVATARRGGMDPSLILSSPYLRAMQTARLVAERLGYEGKIVTSDTLVPHSSPEDVWRELRVYGDERSILLSSHEPLIGSTVGYLLNCPSLALEVKKASVICIELPQTRGVPRGVLQWMITPKISLDEDIR